MTVYRHRLSGIGVNGELWVTTLHTESASSISDAGDAVGTFVTSIWTGALAARWSTGVSLASVTTDELDPDTGKNVAQYGVEWIYAGTATDKPMSPRDCLLVSLDTALPTRRGHGRMFWPAFTAASIDTDGSLTSAAATAAGVAFGTALTTLSATQQVVVYHRAVFAPLTIPPTIPRPVLVTPSTTAVNRLRIGDRQATQKRRTNKTPNTYVYSSV
jgi:hypothetical protein